MTGMTDGRTYPNFIWNEEHNCIFTYVPKVACTNWKSVMRYLARQPDWLSPKLAHDRVKGGLHFIDPDGPERHLLFDPSIPRYSCVRDPYSRSLSAYLDKIENRLTGVNRKRENDESRLRAVERFRSTKLDAEAYPAIDFEVFLRWVRDGSSPLTLNEHWAPQSAILKSGEVEYTFIARFEHLAEDAAELLERMGCDIPFPSQQEVRFRPNNADNRLETYLTPACRELIDELYAEDFRAFGYEHGAPRGNG